mgnify:CR=1 FL=1|jgi:hypothetical protein|nr:MAG TPA: hypothetical protein [Caudoviricetes sp.]
MVEVKFVTSKELVKQMAQQPLALRKRITETLEHGVAGDRDAVDWIDGTPESRKDAVRKLIKEALDDGTSLENVKLRCQGMNYLLLCLGELIKDSKEVIEELEQKKQEQKHSYGPWVGSRYEW